MTAGRRIALALALAAAFAASGCASLAERIAEPHGAIWFDHAAFARKLEQDGVHRRDLTTPDGVRISWLDIPAAERGFEYSFRRRVEGGESVSTFDSRNTHAPRPVPPRGTVVFLHGWEMDATSMLGWAEALSERGWRGVAMDLRNSGASARAPAGYGTREARDVAALVDDLEARGEAPGPVFLFGVSYGAATALFAEPLLRGRVAGIVAMEPFGNAAGAVRDLARLHYSDATIARAIAGANERLGLDLAAIDTASPLAASRTCTLLLHGAGDRIVPVATARRLAAVAPALARYLELPGETHVTLPLRIDRFADPLAGWMQAVGAGGCPPLTLPPDLSGR